MSPPSPASEPPSQPNDETGSSGTAPPPAARGPTAAKATASLPLALRRAHAAAAPWVLAPLLLTVSTGMAYRLLRDWGGLGRDQAHGLMVLHEGEWLRHWLGAGGETLYVLLNGLGLIWMLGSGAAMLLQRWKRRPSGESRGGGT